MLTVAVDSESSSIGHELRGHLDHMEVKLTRWPVTSRSHLGHDLVITDVAHVGRVIESLRGLHRPPGVAVVDVDLDEERARQCLRKGALGVIDLERTGPAEAAAAVVAVAAGFAVIPAAHAQPISSRLERPPELSSFELEFLRAARSQSIESASDAVGLSRRQGQRRFKTLMSSLGLANHLEAVIAATRWGLVEECHSRNHSGSRSASTRATRS